MIGCVCGVFAQEGPRIKSITVRGNVRVSKEAILGTVRSKVGDLVSIDQLDKDKEEINQMGWFSKVSYLRTVEADNNFSIIFDVSEFKPVREVQIVGNKVISTADLLKLVTFAPAPGTPEDQLKPYNLRENAPVGAAIRKAYEAKGYFAGVEGILPSVDNGTVTIFVREVIIRSVSVSGLTTTQQRVFERLIKSRPGEPFSRQEWERDYQRVVNTSWFEVGQPMMPTQNDELSGFVDLKMGLNDAPNGQFLAGVILDPRTSFAGNIGYSTQNYKGTGQSIGLNYQQPTIGLGGSVSLNYGNPFIDKSDTNFQASIYDRVILRFNQGLGFQQGLNNLQDQYSERRTGGAISFSRPAKDRSIAGISARYERVNTPLLTQQNLNFIQQDGEVGAISFNKTWNSRDLDLDPSRGKFIRMDIEPGYSVIKPVGAAPSPEGRFGFLKVGFDYRAYFTPDKRRRTMQDESFQVNAFRLRGGVVSGTVPFFEQFFAGGPDSVRGYFQDRFWGKYMLVGTFEHRRPVSNAFSLVGFFDYGSAWGGYSGVNDFSQSASADFKISYGIGIRFRTKIGAIRIEYAINGDGQSLPVFMIGNNF
jgi:outer membrane protein insertion porin family